MFSTLSPKRKIAEFTSLPEDVRNQIPSINDHPLMLEAGQKLKCFQSDLVRLRHELETCYEGASGPSVYQGGIDADALRVVQGVPISEIGSATPAGLREKLRHQMRVCEKVIEMQLQQLSALEVRLIQEGCRGFENIAATYYEAVLNSFAQLEQSLKNLAKFYDFLSRKGYRVDRRPRHWQLTDLENQLLFGGNLHPCLAMYLSQRRKVWKLDGEKE